MASTSYWSHLAWEHTATPWRTKPLTDAVVAACSLHHAPSDTRTRETGRVVITIAPGLGEVTHPAGLAWTMVLAEGAVRGFVSILPGSKNAAKTTTAEIVKFAQVAWRPLVATMVTAKMACVVLGDVGATQDSEEQPANCVPPAIMAPTAQSAAVGSRDGVMRALKVLESAPVKRAGRGIAARLI